jgi:5-methyltetrahydrofolate--homocysteine methyltransferase
MHEKLSAIYEAILDGSISGAVDGVQAALLADLQPEIILNDGMISAMKEVGRRFEAGDYYVPEMLVAASAMQAALSILKPRLVENNVKSAGKVAIGTVKGDLHDIGKNLVALMLEGAGFEILDLGVDVPPEKFVEAISAGDVNIVALSALLTTTCQI